MNDHPHRWAGTRAEREWLATLRRLVKALENIAHELQRLNDEQQDPGEVDTAS